ncbi:hypothetical protein D3C75_1028240 [compost metagenome]
MLRSQIQEKRTQQLDQHMDGHILHAEPPQELPQADNQKGQNGAEEQAAYRNHQKAEGRLGQGENACNGGSNSKFKSDQAGGVIH